jgi:hypothetical protein
MLLAAGIVHGAGSEHSPEWYGQQAVYRVSMGNFVSFLLLSCMQTFCMHGPPASPLGALLQLFFGIMALAMVGVRYKSDKRDVYLQHGGWFVKIALWLLCGVLPFLFPVGFVNGYGWVARVGSAGFLCVQILMLLDFVTAWNDAWVDKDDDRYLWALLSLTVGCYAGAAALAAVLLVFFKPAGAGDCSFNVSMIVLTLLVGVLLSGVSMSAWVRFVLLCSTPCMRAL